MLVWVGSAEVPGLVPCSVGTEDTVVPLEESKRLAARFSNAEWLEQPGRGRGGFEVFGSRTWGGANLALALGDVSLP